MNMRLWLQHKQLSNFFWKSTSGLSSLFALRWMLVTCQGIHSGGPLWGGTVPMQRHQGNPQRTHVVRSQCLCKFHLQGNFFSFSITITTHNSVSAHSLSLPWSFGSSVKNTLSFNVLPMRNEFHCDSTNGTSNSLMVDVVTYHEKSII
jgi:hypothetical protein